MSEYMPTTQTLVDALETVRGYIGLSYYRGERLTDREHDDAVAKIVLVQKALAEVLTRDVTAPAKPVSDTDREALGEVLALVDDYDGCHQRIRDWERGAYPDEEPFAKRRAEFWNRRADAALAWFAARTSQPVQVEVTTAEELDALPNDAVILDSMGDVGVVHGEYVWYPESNPIRRGKVGANYLPARVLYSRAALGGGDHA